MAEWESWERMEWEVVTEEEEEEEVEVEAYLWFLPGRIYAIAADGVVHGLIDPVHGFMPFIDERFEQDYDQDIIMLDDPSDDDREDASTHVPSSPLSEMESLSSHAPDSTHRGELAWTMCGCLKRRRTEWMHSRGHFV